MAMEANGDVSYASLIKTNSQQISEYNKTQPISSSRFQYEVDPYDLIGHGYVLCAG
jgi:hypothetical protein